MIHLECDNDEALVLALGKTRRQIEHHSGKPRVSHALSKSSNSGDIGLIDEDPGQPPPPYLRQYQLIEELPALGLKLYRHPREGKHLVEIQPDLEPWLYNVGQTVGVRPHDHNLPEKHTILHQQGKRHREHLRSYLRACCDAMSPHLLQLSQWLSKA